MSVEQAMREALKDPQYSDALSICQEAFRRGNIPPARLLGHAFGAANSVSALSDTGGILEDDPMEIRPTLRRSADLLRAAADKLDELLRR